MISEYNSPFRRISERMLSSNSTNTPGGDSLDFRPIKRLKAGRFNNYQRPYAIQ
ncbi:MAG: hypothetical protein JW720_04030 [Sedimentisphaerales bacterium]|nr:hypothetical protein [Sedimentisphaerales bacterium]